MFSILRICSLQCFTEFWAFMNKPRVSYLSNENLSPLASIRDQKIKIRKLNENKLIAIKNQFQFNKTFAFRIVQLLFVFRLSLRKMCPYSEFFWSVFLRIRTVYGEILRISPYSVRMRENTEQKNSKYGHFSRSVF